MAVLLLLLLDASAPIREPALPAQALGNSYGWQGLRTEGGLAVESWNNHALGRRELWTRWEGEPFLNVDAETWVHAVHVGGRWVTDPGVRLVFRGGAWRRRSGLPASRT